MTQPQKQIPPDVSWGCGAKGSAGWAAGQNGEVDGARGALGRENLAPRLIGPEGMLALWGLSLQPDPWAV